jgi:3-hydroxyacyl-[acyl-carrier-protein] dehydratase
MAASKEEIYRAIPHRPPFLWVDRIITRSDGAIETEKDIPEDLDIFTGHYPDRPLMPGVLLCEAIFQSGAILLASLDDRDGRSDNRVPVLTRISNAKFKREVKPGDTLQINVKIKEQVGPAWFMKGSLKVAGKTAVKVDFACTLVENDR